MNDGTAAPRRAGTYAQVVRVGEAELLELWVTLDGAQQRFTLTTLALATLLETGASELATALRRQAGRGLETFSGVSGRAGTDGAVRAENGA